MSGFFLAPAISRPRGTAALSAQVADSTATGGNTRGANAVDWQTARDTATRVASGAQAVIGGGQSNTASAQYSTVSGGTSSAATALAATIAGGNSNTAGGIYSWVPGGNFADVRAAYGKGAWASGRFVASGDAQAGEFVLRKQTTDATVTRLTADAAAAGTTNTANLPNFGQFTGRLYVAGKKAGTTDCADWVLDIAAVRGNGAGTTVLYKGASSAIAPTASNGTVAGMALTVAADTTNGGIAISVTGVAATTINWVARFLDVEAVTAS